MFSGAVGAAFASAWSVDVSTSRSIQLALRVIAPDDAGAERQEDDQVEELQPDQPRLERVGLAEVGQPEGQEGQGVPALECRAAPGPRAADDQAREDDPGAAFEQV